MATVARVSGQPLPAWRRYIQRMLLLLVIVPPMLLWMWNPWSAILLPVAIAMYAYVLYPLLVSGLARISRQPTPPAAAPASWPSVSVSLPVYNEGRVIRSTLDALLDVDYPRELLEIVVISDCSSDDTDAIVSEYADRRVRLVRQPYRQGKTAAECAGAAVVRGEIVINTDASTRFPKDAFKRLVCVFQDETIGLASGRDVTVADEGGATAGEGGYTNFEMRLREGETRIDSIVGASGCFFAVRRALHHRVSPSEISRDFSSAVYAKLQGYRSVSVTDAVCYVRLAASLRVEFRRKIRTMARGLDTLWYKRAALLPWRTSWLFSWMLLSHKLLRWCVFLFAPFSLIALVVFATESKLAALLLIGIALVGLVGLIAYRWPEDRPMPRTISLPGFAALTFLAGALAWWEALTAHRNPIWEPTPRRLS